MSEEAVTEEVKKEITKEVLPGVGVDIGTANICMSRSKSDGSGFTVRHHRNMLYELDANEDAEALLESGEYTYVKDGKKFYVVGEQALSLANAIGHGQLLRPMSDGLINPKFENSRTMLKFIIKAVVGDPIVEGEPLRFSVPANPINSPMDNKFHEMMLTEFFNSMGYEAKAVNEGRCCIFSEAPSMTTDDGKVIPLTGWGISCGGGMVNCCITRAGYPTVQFSITKSGDFIDQQAAMVSGAEISRVIKVKEESLDLRNADLDDPIQGPLCVYYRKFINDVIKAALDELEDGKHVFEGKLPVVICGGTSMVPGFAEEFNKALENSDKPFKTEEAKLVQNPFFAVAQGACRVAESDWKKKNK